MECTASDVLGPWYEIEYQRYPDWSWASHGNKYSNKEVAIKVCDELNKPPPTFTRKVIYP